MFKVLLRQIGQYRKATLLVPLFILLEVALDVLIPYVAGRLIDDGVTAGHLPAVYGYGSLMLLMALLSLLLGILAGRYAALASTGLADNLRKAMYRNIQQFAFSNIDKFGTAGLVTRMTTDVTNLQNAFQMIIRTSVRSPMMLLSSIVMCFVISPEMSMVFVVATVVLSAALSVVITKAARTFSQVFQQYDSLNRSVRENVSGIREVKAFVREDFECEKFSRSARGLYGLYVRAERLMALNHPVMNLVVYGCIIAISWLGAHMVVGGTLTTGQLTSLFSYVMSIMMSLMMLSMIFMQVTMSAASGRRVTEVLTEQPDIDDTAATTDAVAEGSIDFDHVSFAYKGGSGEYALADIDLHIRAGEHIGLIGGTGSGKSSLINLIVRMYDASRGVVKVGGVDVRLLRLQALRRAVAVVQQQPSLFSGTIIDNLRWGKADATMQQCRQACRMACADEFVETLPDGYDTILEQGGANLSGGQRQRLCIARALLCSPQVLVMDDSTSACDNATDATIRQRLSQSLPQMTRITVAQRVSSLSACHRIVVLDNGRIAGCGTHEQLLDTCEVYREMCAFQEQDDADFDSPADNTRKEADR